jgi:hypothetical protein
MKNYRDSSALVEATVDLPLRKRLRDEDGFTRPHALSETFSALTAGNLSIRTDGDTAAQIIGGLADDLKFVDSTRFPKQKKGSLCGKGYGHRD